MSKNIAFKTNYFWRTKEKEKGLAGPEGSYQEAVLDCLRGQILEVLKGKIE